MHCMRTPPALDSHTHLDVSLSARVLAACGPALAMTLSLDEAETALRHTGDRAIVWGVGCHPGALDAQKAFTVERFRKLVERAAIIGEIGLDFVSAVPRSRQLETFRAELAVARELNRPASVHSQNAVAAVLDEVERAGTAIIILHWWTGNDDETRRAVELGCWFSLPAVLAAERDVSGLIPLERLLVETDSGYGEPPAAIPSKIEEAERLLAAQYGLEPAAFRRSVWESFRELAGRTGLLDRLPVRIATLLRGLCGG